jgi:hypothetical protein
MNNQDKEAFEKWFKDFYQIDRWDPRLMNQSIAWQAACEYMRNKSNPLDALSLYEKLETERAKNKKLRDALAWYADRKNCDNPDFVHIEIDEHGEEIADGGYRAREALKENE